MRTENRESEKRDSLCALFHYDKQCRPHVFKFRLYMQWVYTATIINVMLLSYALYFVFTFRLVCIYMHYHHVFHFMAPCSIRIKSRLKEVKKKSTFFITQSLLYMRIIWIEEEVLKKVIFLFVPPIWS